MSDDQGNQIKHGHYTFSGKVVQISWPIKRNMKFYPQLIIWTYGLLPVLCLLLSPTLILGIARAQQQRARLMADGLTARSRAAAALARNQARMRQNGMVSPFRARYSNGIRPMPLRIREKRDLHNVGTNPWNGIPLRGPQRNNHWDQQEESLTQLQNMWNMNNFGSAPMASSLRTHHIPTASADFAPETMVGRPRIIGKQADHDGIFFQRNIYDDMLSQENPMTDQLLMSEMMPPPINLHRPDVPAQSRDIDEDFEVEIPEDEEDTDDGLIGSLERSHRRKKRPQHMPPSFYYPTNYHQSYYPYKRHHEDKVDSNLQHPMQPIEHPDPNVGVPHLSEFPTPGEIGLPSLENQPRTPDVNHPEARCEEDDELFGKAQSYGLPNLDTTSYYRKAMEDLEKLNKKIADDTKHLFPSIEHSYPQPEGAKITYDKSFLTPPPNSSPIENTYNDDNDGDDQSSSDRSAHPDPHFHPSRHYIHTHIHENSGIHNPIYSNPIHVPVHSRPHSVVVQPGIYQSGFGGPHLNPGGNLHINSGGLGQAGALANAQATSQSLGGGFSQSSAQASSQSISSIQQIPVFTTNVFRNADQSKINEQLHAGTVQPQVIPVPPKLNIDPQAPHPIDHFKTFTQSVPEVPTPDFDTLLHELHTHNGPLPSPIQQEQDEFHQAPRFIRSDNEYAEEVLPGLSLASKIVQTSLTQNPMLKKGQEKESDESANVADFVKDIISSSMATSAERSIEIQKGREHLPSSVDQMEQARKKRSSISETTVGNTDSQDAETMSTGHVLGNVAPIVTTETILNTQTNKDRQNKAIETSTVEDSSEEKHSDENSNESTNETARTEINARPAARTTEKYTEAPIFTEPTQHFTESSTANAETTESDSNSSTTVSSTDETTADEQNNTQEPIPTSQPTLKETNTDETDKNIIDTNSKNSPIHILTTILNNDLNKNVSAEVIEEIQFGIPDNAEEHTDGGDSILGAPLKQSNSKTDGGDIKLPEKPPSDYPSRTMKKLNDLIKSMPNADREAFVKEELLLILEALSEIVKYDAATKSGAATAVGTDDTEAVASPNLFYDGNYNDHRSAEGTGPSSNGAFDTILGAHKETLENIQKDATDDDLLMISDSVVKDLEDRRSSQTMQPNKSQETNRSKRGLNNANSVPITRLVSDPTSKINVPKTLENVGTVVRHTLENSRAPIYHVRNLIGNTKNTILSAAKIPPNNIIIPSQYEIAKISEKPEQDENVGAINQNLLHSRSSISDVNSASENSEVLTDAFQKIGSILQESVNSGKNVIVHANDAATDARNILYTANHAVPRLIVPGSIPNLGSRSAFPSANPLGNKAILLLPRILDVDENIVGAEENQGPDHFVGLGNILDAVGFTNPKNPPVEVERIVLEPLAVDVMKQWDMPRELKSSNAVKTWIKDNLKMNKNERLGSIRNNDDAAEDSVGAKGLKDFLNKTHQEMKEILASQREQRKSRRKNKTERYRSRHADSKKDSRLFKKEPTRKTIVPIEQPVQKFDSTKEPMQLNSNKMVLTQSQEVELSKRYMDLINDSMQQNVAKPLEIFNEDMLQEPAVNINKPDPDNVQKNQMEMPSSIKVQHKPLSSMETPNEPLVKEALPDLIKQAESTNTNLPYDVFTDDIKENTACTKHKDPTKLRSMNNDSCEPKTVPESTTDSITTVQSEVHNTKINKSLNIVSTTINNGTKYDTPEEVKKVLLDLMRHSTDGKYMNEDLPYDVLKVFLDDIQQKTPCKKQKDQSKMRSMKDDSCDHETVPETKNYSITKVRDTEVNNLLDIVSTINNKTMYDTPEDLPSDVLKVFMNDMKGIVPCNNSNKSRSTDSGSLSNQPCEVTTTPTKNPRFVQQKVPHTESNINSTFNNRENFSVHQSQENDTVGLYLAPELLKPFMGEPSQSMFNDFMRENSNDNKEEQTTPNNPLPMIPLIDPVKPLNLSYQQLNGQKSSDNLNKTINSQNISIPISPSKDPIVASQLETTTYHNDLGDNLGHVLGAQNPLVFEKYYKESLKSNDALRSTADAGIDPPILKERNTTLPTDAKVLSDSEEKRPGTTTTTTPNKTSTMSESGTNKANSRTSMTITGPFQRPFMGYRNKKQIREYLNQFNSDISQEIDSDLVEELVDDLQ